MEEQTQIVPFNYFKTAHGNILWGAALTLAWKQLQNSIICEPLKLKSQSIAIKNLVKNFNHSTLSQDDLSSQCCTISVNTEKTPSKKSQKSDSQPISITVKVKFYKNMKFEHPFTKKQVKFNEKSVPGFEASSLVLLRQVIVHQYTNSNEFIVQLKTKAVNDEIYLIKTTKNYQCHEVFAQLPDDPSTGKHLKKDDVFQMPKISVHYLNKVKVVGTSLANKNYQGYFFQKCEETIELDVDETGVKIKNKAVIILRRCKRAPVVVEKKLILLNKPFWIVMKQKEKKNPYFIGFIRTLMQKSK